MLMHVAAGESRPLLAPCIVDLESQEYSRLMRHLEVFAELGMLIEDFGSQSLIVKAVPSVLASKELARLLINVANSASLRRGSCERETLAKLLASEAGVGPNEGLSPYELCQKMKDVREVRDQIGFALTQDELQDRLARKGIRRE